MQAIEQETHARDRDNGEEAKAGQLEGKAEEQGGKKASGDQREESEEQKTHGAAQLAGSTSSNA